MKKDCLQGQGGDEVPEALHAKMFVDDSQPDGNEKDAAEHLHPLAQQYSRPFAEKDPRHGEKGADNADDYTGIEDGLSLHADDETHRQRVDAGGHGQGDQGEAARGVPAEAVLFVGGEGIPYHLAADQGKEGQSHPVIVIADPGFHVFPGGIADHGHEELKEPEMEGQAEIMPEARFLNDEPRRQGYRKGVHGQAHRNTQNVEMIHNPSLSGSDYADRSDSAGGALFRVQSSGKGIKQFFAGATRWKGRFFDKLVELLIFSF